MAGCVEEALYRACQEYLTFDDHDEILREIVDFRLRSHDVGDKGLLRSLTHGYAVGRDAGLGLD